MDYSWTGRKELRAMRQIKITYGSGEKVDYPAGVKAHDIIGRMGALTWPLAAILVNNELLPLDAELLTDCSVEPVTIDTAQGAATYRRSLCFLLALAARELYPGRRLLAGMAIGTGFFHFFDDDEPIREKELSALETRMRELVARDIAIGVEWRSWADAVQ
jgi:uridine kinase